MFSDTGDKVIDEPRLGVAADQLGRGHAGENRTNAMPARPRGGAGSDSPADDPAGNDARPGIARARRSGAGRLKLSRYSHDGG